MPLQRGPIRLFQFRGIAVFLHWSWFLVAIYEIGARRGAYSSIAWNVLEYLALFAIVTLHEFGHAFACRSVGGRANQILLWPLGGIAFVDPPVRPGAVLWSIAAGPLVNVGLVPVLGGLVFMTSPSDLHALLRAIAFTNFGLLIFNLLPIYPLDGGQILCALLWFVVGRARALVVTAVIGLAGVLGFAGLALLRQSPWLAIIAFFIAERCFGSFKLARSLNQIASAPRRENFACPSCRAHPPVGAFWGCRSCGAALDLFDPSVPASTGFETTTALNLSFKPSSASGKSSPLGQCPHCHEDFVVRCPDCGATGVITDWSPAVVTAPLPNVLGVRTRQPRPPSMVGVWVGAGLLMLAVVPLLAALVFFSISSSETGLRPRYQAEIDSLWALDGIPVPGERTVQLAGGRHDAYVETLTTEGSGLIEVSVTSGDSGRQLAVRPTPTSRYFQRGGRQLSSAATFVVTTPGWYSVRVSKPENVPDDASVKIGPSFPLVSGAAAAVSRGIAIAALILAVLLITTAVWFFARHRIRLKAFNGALQQFPESL